MKTWKHHRFLTMMLLKINQAITTTSISNKSKLSPRLEPTSWIQNHEAGKQKRKKITIWWRRTRIYSIKLNYDLGWSEFWLKEHLILSNFQVSYLVQRQFFKNLIVSGWTQLNIFSLEGRIKSSLGSQSLHYRVGCLEFSVYLEVSRLWRAELF